MSDIVTGNWGAFVDSGIKHSVLSDVLATWKCFTSTKSVAE